MQVTLVVPRLWNALDAVNRLIGSSWSGYGAWEGLLSRGRCESFGRADLEATILEAAGVANDPAQDVPVAAISRFGDGILDEDGLWLRADPVSLRVDRDQLLLASWELNDLNEAAAASLAGTLIPLFEPLGWKLFTPVPQRWYVKLPDGIQLRTYSPRSSFGASIMDRLPTGPDAVLIRRVLTEVQMTLHGAAENQTRIRQQQDPVNSVWFWGLGVGMQRVPAFAQQVWSDDSFLIGLARRAQVPHAPLPHDPQTLSLKDGVNWLSFSQLDQGWRRGNVQVLAEELERFQLVWVAPLIKLLGRSNELVIISDTGVSWKTTRPSPLRWWTRRPSLASSLAQLVPNSGLAKEDN